MLKLGLDLGTNSIGWALFQLDDGGNAQNLLDGGVLVFPDGRIDGSSKAAKRREKRGTRRNRDRILARRSLLNHALCDLGLLPTESEERDRVFTLLPWDLRAAALDRTLEPYELGRALWSFYDRRGFKSNRKTDTPDEKGKLAQDMEELRRRIAQSGSRTYGEYLYKRLKQGKVVKARLGNGLYPSRQLVEDEFNKIREEQCDHHELSDEDWDVLFEILFFQRSLRAPDRGRCLLNQHEERGYRAWPLFQHFRILSDLSLMTVAMPTQASRPLNKAERDILFGLLLKQKRVSFDKICTVLDLPPDTMINLETEKRTGLDGDQTAALLTNKKRWGPAYRSLSLEQQQALVEKLLDEEDETALLDWLHTEHGLGKEQAKAVADTPLPGGTGSLGRTALNDLVPIMRDQGLAFADAVKEAGYDSHSDFRHDGSAPSLPYYGKALQRHVIGGRPDAKDDVERYGRLSNPTVHIALGQMRKLFNEIIERYGEKPTKVVVELARDLKQSEAERKETDKRQKRNQDKNERLKKQMEDAGQPFSGHLLRKLQIWDEQGRDGKHLCPFTGKVISLGQALSPETEIEHILPFSRTWDDSRNNKVIAYRNANREKGNRTPYEAWGHDADRYRAIQERALAIVPGKAWRFTPDAMNKFDQKGGFLGRQLNDTRYLSRIIREYLSVCVRDQNIGVSPGRLTAMLRGKWGLNSLLGDSNVKERLDHRHHLIDAIVVGLTTRSLLQRIQTAAEKSADRDRLIADMPVPWEGFRDDVRALLDRTIVHFKPNHAKSADGATTGSLHNDTAYGPLYDRNGDLCPPDEEGMYTFVYRKLLANIGEKGIASIRDRALADRIWRAWENWKNDRKMAGQTIKWEDFAAAYSKQHNVRSVRVLDRQGAGSVVFIRDKQGKPYKAYKTNGNAYMDVWLLPNGKTKGETVSRFDTHQKDYASPVQAEFPTAKKLMRLHINDMIAIGEGEQRRILCVKTLTGQTILAVDHNEAGDLRKRERTKDKALQYKPFSKSAGQVLQVGLRKVHVSRTGRILDGGPFRRKG